MRKPNGHELKVLFILSIVAPVSILISLRLTHVLQEPPTPETLMVEPVSWQMERPSWTVTINETAENVYKDENISMVFSILIFKYFDNMGPPFGFTDDIINMNVSVRADVINGFVESIRVVFREEYKPSYVNIPDPTEYSVSYETLNVSVIDWADHINKWWNFEKDTKAFIRAVGINQPSNVRFLFPAYWILKDEENRPFQIQITTELTYRTEQTHKKLVLPIQLKLIVNVGAG